MATPVSFADQIKPIFSRFKGAMMWRFDLTNYDHVKANATVIYTRIKAGGDMPPPPFKAFSAQEIALFKTWMDEGYNP